MQAKNEISDELRLLSAVVSGISRETPYGVPAGYFDGFSALVLRLIGSEEGAGEPSFAIEGDKPLTFSVPEGYFDGFAENLLNRIKAGQGVSRTNSEAEAAMNGAETAMGELEELSPLLNSISREMPYGTPEGYFASLSPVLPILAEVREKPLYAVPEGYFDGLAGEIIEKVQEKSIKKVGRPARVISLGQGVRQRSWWKYSAAAVVAGFIFTIGWLRLHTPTGAHNNHPSVDVASNLVKVSDQDLQSYLDDQNDQNPTLTEPMNSTATLDITDSDVKSLLGDVPDGDLKTYMEEHGGPNDIATN